MKTSVRESIRWARLRTAAVGIVLAGLLGACATGPNASPKDPWEPFNRGVTRFNETVDDAVTRPIATVYVKTVPEMVRTGVGNFFGNLGDVWSFANSVFQLHLQDSVQTFMRVNVNTFFGLGGVLDVASEARLPRHREDFGQTLGRWGVPAGPYLVLPLLGPSTLRDTVALPVDFEAGLISQVHDIPVRNSMYVLNFVDTRASLLKVEQMLGDLALDKYSLTRDVFLQRRQNDVYDGNPPDDDDDGGKD